MFSNIFSIKHIHLIVMDFLFSRFPGLLMIFPAIVIGCSPHVLPEEEPTQCSQSIVRYFKKLGEPVFKGGGTLDILTFEDDRLMRLDSYLRFDEFQDMNAYAESTGGDKIFFLCANSRKDRFGWSDIRSYHSLRETTLDLEDESISFPLMTGECRTKAGGIDGEAQLSPAACMIRLKRISCDFSGTPYAGKKITEARAYLTNVNATCRLLQKDSDPPMRIINSGQLNEFEIKNFDHKEAIVQTIADEIGTSPLTPEAEFLCYPNTGEFPTRLVIEGKIGSELWYWPITIEDGLGGPRKGYIYSYDIHIRRKGTDSPDIPVEIKEIEIGINIRSWKETTDCSVRF